MPGTSIPRRALKAASRAADIAHAPLRGITILIYHRVGATTGGQMNVSPGEFERQLEWLTQHERVVTLDDAVDEITGAGPIEPAVVLTFDDGTADWSDVVAPLLADYRVPATFYLTTAYPELEIALPDGERPVSWGGLSELVATGFATIGSHTHTHRLLDRIDPANIAGELDRSIELITAQLGAPPRHFAYPKAVDPSAAAHDAVSHRFRSAALAGTRANAAGGDPHRLTRSPVQAADSFADFTRKARGGMGFEDLVRQRLNRVRYRSARS